MKHVETLASFIAKARFEDLSSNVKGALKIHILDSLGCALGAIGSEPMNMLRKQVDDFGGNSLVTLIGGGKTAPDRAAFYNGALIRYLDYNDSFLAKKETCHPSDNLSSVLAACEYMDASGKELLTSLAIAYQVQCRMSEEAPVRHKGFDHTTQGAYSVAAGVSKALNLKQSQIANAIAMAAVPNNALRVTRTGALSHWKGLAFPNTAFSATHNAFLAMRGITGPLEVFEGNKGFIETISGPFTLDWTQEKLNIIEQCILKKYNAEIHSQSAIEGIIELRDSNQIKADEIDHIDVDIFDVAFHIIGGGEEGGKKAIRTKEEADHSLPYMLAAAFLDGVVTPQQYLPQRILKSDIQSLLTKIDIHPNSDYSRRFPKEMCCRIQIHLKSGKAYEISKSDYEGFVTKPMSWEHAVKKFNDLAAHAADESLRTMICDHVHHLESMKVSAVTSLLAKVVRQKA